ALCARWPVLQERGGAGAGVHPRRGHALMPGTGMQADRLRRSVLPAAGLTASRQKPKEACAAGGGPTVTPSMASSFSLVAEPPGAENPPILLPAARMRWQGTMIGTGLAPSAAPVSRARPAWPAADASPP